MGSVLQLTNPAVVAAFRAALLRQGIVELSSAAQQVLGTM